MLNWTTAAVFFLLGLALVLYLWRRRAWPCPPWLAVLLENPYVEAVAGSREIIKRAEIGKGMNVLDVGCGPGRLTLPVARIVGEEGRVVALDLQQAMLDRVKERAEKGGVRNIAYIHAGAGEGRIKRNVFDRALLVTVLGEIRDQESALDEIYGALKTNGLLSVTEVMPDPHYVGMKKVRRLAESAGFKEHSAYGNRLAFTINFIKLIEDDVA